MHTLVTSCSNYYYISFLLYFLSITKGQKHGFTLPVERLGTAQRKFRNQVVTEKTTKSSKVWRMKDMGGNGKVTDYIIQKLQRYFAIAIHHFRGTVEGLHNDIFSIFLHCFSSGENPHHHLCPKTSDSFCFYQQAIDGGDHCPTPPWKWSFNCQVISIKKFGTSTEHWHQTWSYLHVCLDKPKTPTNINI